MDQAPGIQRDRSGNPKVFCKKGILKNYEKLTGKYLCESLFLKIKLKA